MAPGAGAGKPGRMIEIHALTIRYGRAVAVDDLTFKARPGRVTGLLGPDGAGKTSTMRAVVGLKRPHAGIALVDGRPYGMLGNPLRQAGALFDAAGTPGGRTAWAHVARVARRNDIGRGRADEVLAQVGLADVAGRRVRDFSLGMKQRLGIAVALLGDPGALLFDEPFDGLDPEGVRWVRELMRSLAAEGRTVLVSGHRLGEMAVTADHVVVVGRGRLIADTTTAELMARFPRDSPLEEAFLEFTRST